MAKKLPADVLAYFKQQGAKGGRVGGRSSSAAKTAAARENGKKGGRPRTKHGA